MQQYKEIERKAEDALNSLEGLTKASPGPYFYTRLEARISRGSKNVWDQLVFMLNRPVVAIGLALFVIAVNTTVVMQKNESSTLAEQTELTVSEEYNLASNTYLEEVTQEP
jgi:hypothetical protein